LDKIDDAMDDVIERKWGRFPAFVDLERIRLVS
jgi:hypothetical protein